MRVMNGSRPRGRGIPGPGGGIWGWKAGFRPSKLACQVRSLATEAVLAFIDLSSAVGWVGVCRRARQSGKVADLVLGHGRCASPEAGRWWGWAV